MSFIADIVADTFLIAIPLRMLWNVNLRRGERRLILITLTSSVLSSIASIAYALVVFNTQKIGHNRGLAISLVAHLKVRKTSFPHHAFLTNTQASTTLVVCKLLNIVTFLYRLVRASDAEPEITLHKLSSLKLPSPAKSCSGVMDNMMPVSSQNINEHRLDATASFFHDAGVWLTDVDDERSSVSVATGSHPGRANTIHSF